MNQTARRNLKVLGGIFGVVFGVIPVLLLLIIAIDDSTGGPNRRQIEQERKQRAEDDAHHDFVERLRQSAETRSRREKTRELVRLEQYEAATALAIALADEGDAWGQYILGLLYLEVPALKKGPEAALHWMQLAAKQDLPSAQNKLGEMYREGLGTIQDYNMALHWFQRAADRCSTDAQHNLGRMNFTLRDYAQSYMWFNLAAARGHPEAAGLRQAAADLLESSQIMKMQQQAKEWQQRHKCD